MNPGEWLPLLHELADQADGVARRYFRATGLQVTSKPDRSLVTAADLEIETWVRDRLAQQHPELDVYGEERGEDRRHGEVRLIIDPIDGTANFARGIPIFATLLAIEEGDRLVAGVVSAPALETRWHAARGEGAWSGGRRLRVSGVSDLADAQVFHAGLSGSELSVVSQRIPAFVEQTWRSRGFGDFWQHMLVAEGSGEIAVDPMVQPWDIAPIVLIVDEAGGRATSLAGERTIYGGSLVTSNGLLHETALAAFR